MRAGAILWVVGLAALPAWGSELAPAGTISSNPSSAYPQAAPDPDVDAAILAIDGDRAYGEHLASECLTCHQASGADNGIPSITGWPRAEFVTAMHAYRTRHRPHPVMRMIAGGLSEEEIAALAVFFEGEP